MLSGPTLRVLALALLLQACATQPTSNPSAQADGDDDVALRARSPQSPHNALTAKAADKPEVEFDGPQVVFKPGSAEVPAVAGPLLDEIAAKLKADPDVNVLLVGHTEDLGSSEFAVAVAGKCTLAVSQALIKRGARPMQIRTIARVLEKPSKRCNSACLKKQRRVDIVLLQD